MSSAAWKPAFLHLWPMQIQISHCIHAVRSRSALVTKQRGFQKISDKLYSLVLHGKNGKMDIYLHIQQIHKDWKSPHSIHMEIEDWEKSKKELSSLLDVRTKSWINHFALRMAKTQWVSAIQGAIGLIHNRCFSNK